MSHFSIQIDHEQRAELEEKSRAQSAFEKIQVALVYLLFYYIRPPPHLQIW